MAGKKTSSKAGSAGGMMGANPWFDPEQVAKMFDPEQMKGFFAPPASQSVDFNAVMQNNEKNYQAMLSANRSATEAYNDFYQKQMAIFQELMEGAQEMIESSKDSATADAARKQSEIYQEAAKKAFANMTELAEESKKANEEAFAVIEKRVKESLEELKRG